MRRTIPTEFGIPLVFFVGSIIGNVLAILTFKGGTHGQLVVSAWCLIGYCFWLWTIHSVIDFRQYISLSEPIIDENWLWVIISAMALLFISLIYGPVFIMYIWLFEKRLR